MNERTVDLSFNVLTGCNETQIG